MKVVFALDWQGQTTELGEWLKVAIDSVLTNTTLQPFVIMDRASPILSRWLTERDVSFIERQTPLKNRIEDLNRSHGYPLQAQGNYLRYEAVRIVDEPFFLYADCDVIFLKNPDLSHFEPRLMSACPADTPYSYASFNTGVILFNRLAMLEELDHFYAFASDRLLRFFPGFDQAAVNKLYFGKIETLPATMNWRPHWGSNIDAELLHFHGVKLEVLEEAVKGISATNENKREQVLNLAASTLTFLPSLMRRLDVNFIRSHDLLKRLQVLADYSQTVLSAPILENLRHINAIKKQSTEAIYKIFRDETVTRFLSTGQPELTPLRLSPARHRTVRMLLRTAAPTFYISDLYDTDGKVVATIESALKRNLRILGRITNGAYSYVEISRIDLLEPVDLIFENRQFHADDLIIHLVSLTPLQVEYYWHDGEGFSAGMAKFYSVKQEQ